MSPSSSSRIPLLTAALVAGALCLTVGLPPKQAAGSGGSGASAGSGSPATPTSKPVHGASKKRGAGPVGVPRAAGTGATSRPAGGRRIHHDPANPPIDCPLRRAGIDPRKLKPFARVKRYIAFLERGDRAVWQKPAAVVRALGLRGTERVADVGAGSGYFTFPIARALPRGRVYALDIEPEMVRHIHHKAMTSRVGNVRARLVKPDSPRLPLGIDLVFVCDVIHHVRRPARWLGRLASWLRQGARLVVIEFKEGKLPKGPPVSLKIPRAKLVKLVSDAGFRLAGEKKGLLPYQVFLEFRRN